MAAAHTFLTISLVCLATTTLAKPVMVSFGTNQGPIVPRLPKSTSAQDRSAVALTPAPVFENGDDIPNPNTYRPPVPHQYRTKLYSFKPSPNLILGTALDQKNTLGLQKYNLYKKQFARTYNLGIDFTGPHVFERQEYELYNTKTTLQPSVRYVKQYYQPSGKAGETNSKYVPEIGVVYSSGVRYYVPQVVYGVQKQNLGNPKDENSVYDVQDVKYYQ